MNLKRKRGQEVCALALRHWHYMCSKMKGNHADKEREEVGREKWELREREMDDREGKAKERVGGVKRRSAREERRGVIDIDRERKREWEKATQFE